MKTTLDEMADSQVLAMALDDILGLIKWKPDADKKPTINENTQAHDQHFVSKQWLKSGF